MPTNNNTQISPGIGPLPAPFSPIGGCVIDLLGTNGERFTAQVPPSRMWQGWVGSLGPRQYTTDPTRSWIRIASEVVPAADIAARLGGGIAKANLRLTLFDGDSGTPNPVYVAMFGAGNFPYVRWEGGFHQADDSDFDGYQNLFIGFEDAAGNPVNCGFMGETPTYRLDAANQTIETFTGFPGVYALTDPNITVPRPAQYPEPFPTTGWFSVPADKLADLYQALQQGSLHIGLHDVTPGDQYLDFTQGLAADVPDIPLFPPKVLTFVADPDQVTGLGEVTLSWTTQNCDSVSIPGVGAGLPPNGSAAVTVADETTFELTAIGRDGSDTASVLVTRLRPAVSIQFAADSTLLHAKGASTVLRWAVLEADSVLLDGNPVNSSGAQETAAFDSEQTRVYSLIAVRDGVQTEAQVTVELQALPVVILTPSPLPSAGTTKLHYSQQFTASGGFGGYTWSASDLPPGLTMSASGLLSGDFPVTGSITYNIEVSVASEGVLEPATGVFALPFVQAPLTITTEALTPARELEAYSLQLQSMFGRGPTTWSLYNGALPAGLEISEGGVISGVPATFGYWTFTIQVATADEVDRKTYELMVKLGWDRIDLNHHIFYRVRNADGSIVAGMTNDPFPERGGEQVFASLAVGFSVGADEIVLEDARVRGGGLAPAFQDIPEAAHFWDLGHLDGAPYPIGGAAVVYLPADLLDRFPSAEIQAKVESIFPIGAIPVIRYYFPDGEEVADVRPTAPTAPAAAKSVDALTSIDKVIDWDTLKQLP